MKKGKVIVAGVLGILLTASSIPMVQIKANNRNEVIQVDQARVKS